MRAMSSVTLPITAATVTWSALALAALSVTSLAAAIASCSAAIWALLSSFVHVWSSDWRSVSSSFSRSPAACGRLVAVGVPNGISGGSPSFLLSALTASQSALAPSSLASERNAPSTSFPSGIDSSSTFRWSSASSEPTSSNACSAARRWVTASAAPGNVVTGVPCLRSAASLSWPLWIASRAAPRPSVAARAWPWLPMSRGSCGLAAAAGRW